jgi:hypothetical protein
MRASLPVPAATTTLVFEGGIDLGVELAREAQDERGTLHATSPPADHDVVGGSVVLHLLAGDEVVPARAHLRALSETVAAAEGGERGVGGVHAFAGELLLDAHQIARAALEELLDALGMGLERLGTCERGDLGASTGADPPHRMARDPQGAGDRAHAVAFARQP